jgi:hypothetical protein
VLVVQVEDFLMMVVLVVEEQEIPLQLVHLKVILADQFLQVEVIIMQLVEEVLQQLVKQVMVK